MKIGLLVGVTGEYGDFGGVVRRGAEIAVEQMREADVPFVIDARLEDTESSVQGGIDGANALVDAGYPMICGALAADVTMRVADEVAVPNQVPMVTPTVTAPELTDFEDDDYVFRTCPTDALQGRTLANVAYEDLGVRTAATLFLDRVYGQGIDRGFTDRFEGRAGGGDVLAHVRFEPDRGTYVHELATALEDDPETLVVVGDPESGARILRDFYEEFDREDLPVLVADGLRDPGLSDAVGHPVANVTGTAPLTDGPGREFFEERYEDAYGATPPSPFVAHAYDAAAVLMLANASAGNNDGSTIRRRIRRTSNPRSEGGKIRLTPNSLARGLRAAENGVPVNYVGAASEVDFDSNGDMRSGKYEYFGFDEGGEPETIDVIETGV